MEDKNVKKNETKETLDDRELSPKEMDKASGGVMGPKPVKIPVPPKYPQPGQEEGRDGE